MYILKERETERVVGKCSSYENAESLKGKFDYTSNPRFGDYEIIYEDDDLQDNIRYELVNTDPRTKQVEVMFTSSSKNQCEEERLNASFKKNSKNLSVREVHETVRIPKKKAKMIDTALSEDPTTMLKGLGLVAAIVFIIGVFNYIFGKNGK